MLDRLLRILLPHRPAPVAPMVPPVAPVRRVRTTPLEERLRVEQHLRDNEHRLAQLQALAGLDELRNRDPEGQQHHAL